MNDTVVASASAVGRAGIAVLRLSGPDARRIGIALCGMTDFRVRYAHHCIFSDSDGSQIDDGLALYFPAPNSFTGEDVVELQGHGSPVLQSMLVQACLKLGARMAQPGEFSRRAFENDRLDLTQAEAIADLIAAGSARAARSALASLHGEFSRAASALAHECTQLRVYVEAALDFPEEEIDYLADAKVSNALDALSAHIRQTQERARTGQMLRDGAKVVLVGRPNSGKSTLLNALAEESLAIVSDIPGTTRDLLRADITIQGVPLRIVDTAGFRDSDNPIEAEGIKRARAALQDADLVLLLVDVRNEADSDALNAELSELCTVPRLLVQNKCDLLNAAHPKPESDSNSIALSLKTGKGLEALRQRLADLLGVNVSDGADVFSARARHLQALEAASDCIDAARVHHRALDGELMAEELRLAHDHIGEITGRVSSDALLGEIFSSFCIGK